MTTTGARPFGLNCGQSLADALMHTKPRSAAAKALMRNDMLWKVLETIGAQSISAEGGARGGRADTREFQAR
ncbi:hypothetical protein NK8_31540 [Caballeronia sp. NK8]|nr:hypothetical protein NK8_31540 [Caballeronia sp. NK8]